MPKFIGCPGASYPACWGDRVDQKWLQSGRLAGSSWRTLNWDAPVGIGGQGGCSPKWGRDSGCLWGVLSGSISRYSGESQICDARHNWTGFIYMCRQPSIGRSLPAQFWKPARNLYKTCTLSADHQPRTTAFPRRFCGQNQLENTLPRRLYSRRFWANFLRK